MNKKGFTLIELLAVITLIAIISIIAVPNVVKLFDNSKKEQFVTDAKNMLSKAKYMYKLDKYSGHFQTNGDCKIITLANMDLDLDVDSDGNSYNKNESSVKICIENGNLIYYVKTMSYDDEGFATRGVYDKTSIGNYVLENNLTKNLVVNKN